MVDDRDAIRRLLRNKRAVTSSDVARRLRISRQAAHRKLRALAAEGVVAPQGAGRSARWVLPAQVRPTLRLSTAGLEEDRVWRRLADSDARLRSLGPEATAIATYAFSEMLNNAIEHSGSPRVRIAVDHARDAVTFEIADDGIGAFERIRGALGLASMLEAVQELSKGKVTTLPATHSGEGIFFTSKVAQRFELESNGLSWVVDNVIGDFTVRERPRGRGTRVRMVVARVPRRSLQEIFSEYTIDREFARTRTVVRLFAVGVDFVSRSEARRLLAGLERFREVVLDFDRVPGIGQGFADEIFRVWAQSHPGVVLVPVNMMPPVEFMVDRARPREA